MWAPPGVIHAWILDSRAIIMLCARYEDVLVAVLVCEPPTRIRAGWINELVTAGGHEWVQRDASGLGSPCSYLRQEPFHYVSSL
jgi:hypothetical protein